MPTKTLDQTVEQQRNLRESLDTTRAQLASALEAVRHGRHADDLRMLETMQRQLLASGNGDAQRTAESALEGQRRLIDRQHAAEISLINRALDTAGRLSRDTPEAARRAAELLNTATQANSAIVQAVREAMQASTRQLEAAMALADPIRRRERLDDIVNDERTAIKQMDRHLSVAVRDVQRAESLARNVLNAETTAALRNAASAAATSEQIRSVMSDRVLQRLADEALVPGSRQLKDVDRTAAIQRVKGELAEQIALARIRDEVARENQARQADRQLFLVEGNRIRDDRGRKLTDGLIVWRNNNDQLQLWRALEVKAGIESARALNEKLDRLTRNDERELRAFARDLARAAERHTSFSRAHAEMDTRVRAEEAALRSDVVQRQEGQAAQTRERLDVVDRIRVDGQTQVLVRDTNERRLQNAVLKAIADDALRNEKDALRLGVTARELEAIAKAYVDELLRRREV